MSCIYLRTGRTDCQVRFHPLRFQLSLIQADQEERIELGFSGSRVLERLLQSPGEVVSRDELLQYAWHDRVVSQGSLNQQIYTLRQLLHDERQREIIQTLPRRGYMFNPGYLLQITHEAEPPEEPAVPAPLATVPAPVPAQEDPAPALRPAPPRFEPRWSALRLWRQRLPMMLGAGVLGLTLIGAVQVYQPPELRAMATETLRVGQLDILLVEDNAEQLAELKRNALVFRDQLARVARRPADLLMYSSADFYEVICLQPDGRANWLMVHQDQVGRVSDQQWRRCLQ
ncbi:winged helix-turn-helix domain-containing protein [Pseudomonas otitidis]|uniref:Winged helix-turn-helix domain-containing protein n=1 Tax=Metapseudomonas otitidis TaxID=319939 RepID=A0ABU3XYZ4_9GAMM|nr:winged helix-turn-helix domain-containing protein [Pseudomonas otitidis]MDV3443099.1 winged helix-turn-helix domain-containing protein [Pseudomonas otitidis]WMR33052.1 winged helix-turn-helix domain-containing protein [Pseudomonas otitidis]